VMEAARAVYAYGKYLIAALQGKAASNTYVEFLADTVHEMNAGFGFSPGDEDEEQSIELASTFSSAQDRKIAPILQVLSMAMDQVISNLGLRGGDPRHEAAWNMQEKKLSKMLPNYRLIAAEKGVGAARQLLSQQLSDKNLRTQMAGLSQAWQDPAFQGMLSEVLTRSTGAPDSPVTGSARLVRELISGCKKGLDTYSGLDPSAQPEPFPVPAGFLN